MQASGSEACFDGNNRLGLDQCRWAATPALGTARVTTWEMWFLGAGAISPFRERRADHEVGPAGDREIDLRPWSAQIDDLHAWRAQCVFRASIPTSIESRGGRAARQRLCESASNIT